MKGNRKIIRSITLMGVPPSFSANEYSYSQNDRFTAREGSTIDLRCRLYANEQEGRYITWSKESGPLPQKAMETGTGILRLPEVVKEDEGRYICDNGEQRQYVFLEIEGYQGELFQFLHHLSNSR